MRLLDAWTGQFVEKDPRHPDTKYAILSHTWDREGEQTYEDLRSIQKRYAAGLKRQSSNSSRQAQGKPPSSTNSHEDVAPLTPSQTFLLLTLLLIFISLLSPQNTLKTKPSAIRGSPPSAPAASPPNASSLSDSSPEGNCETPLSRIWEDHELSPKIREACKVARENGYHYIWIDSCCIDKTSSSELSEAINSMYHWYSRATMCFAFLADVPDGANHEAKDSEFRRSRWFTRGWTLQELIAPLQIVFLSMSWTPIGSKSSLASLVTGITGICHDALLRIEPLREFSVAQRLSWAATRETTRVEDQAYSLLGIFDINMPTLYGEGHGAFRRLQEEILRRIPDQTIFAWTSFSLDSPTQHRGLELDSATFQQVSYSHEIPSLDRSSLLASSPDLFRSCGRIEPVSRDEVVRRLEHDLPAAEYYFTPHGIRTQFAMIPFSAYFPAGYVTDLKKHFLNFIPLSQWYLAVLGCEHQDYPGHLLGRVCYTQCSSSSNIEFPYCGFVEISFPMTPFDPSQPFEIVLPTTLFDPTRRFDLLPLSPASLKNLSEPEIRVGTVYIPHAEEYDGVFEVTRWTPHDTIKMVLLKHTRDELRAKGYDAELLVPDPSHPNIHSLVLTHAAHTIAVEFQHTLSDGPRPDDQRLTVRNRVTVSGHPRGTSIMHSSLPWARSLGFGGSHIAVDLPGTGEFLMSSELTLATKDHYAIHVELRPKSSTRESEPVRGKLVFEQRKLEIGPGEMRVIGGAGASGSLARALEARTQWRRKYGPGGALDASTPWRFGRREAGNAGAVLEERPGEDSVSVS